MYREWSLRADPDGTDPAERDKDAHVSTTFGGSVRVDGNLEAVGGEIFKNAVDHIHPYGQGGETIPTNGRGACHPCNRTRPQRRFDGDPPPEPDSNDPP